jgi:hypothetical protein
MPFYYQYIASSLPFSNPGLFTEDPMVGALRTQSTACEALGSYMYRDLFTALADDYEDGGRTYAILAGRSDRPVHDAIPLRLAGAIHKVVLDGLEPRLARHYPSMGGSPGEDFTADFIGYMKDHIDDIEMGLGRQVQTNEVGRSVVHLVLSHWLTTLDITEFDFLEVGASAGLNLNFDKFYACFGQLRMGSQQSPLRFMGDWFGNAPDVPRIGATVRRRRGTDISPIDLRNNDQATRLLSFIWPDQKARFERTQFAIDIAREHPPIVDNASADTWIGQQFQREQDCATVVFHSIVWQYLGKDVQQQFKDSMMQFGESATKKAPLIWARMEPSGPVADVRVTVWNGKKKPSEFRLAEVGYHGQNFTWL